MIKRRALLGAAALSLVGASGAILAATPIGRMDLPWWRARHEAALRRVRQGHVDLVFLGDSITQDWERHGPPEFMDFQTVWNRFYGDRNALNLGFIGDTTASVLWRIQHGELEGIDPKVVVLLIGANNLGRVHWPAQDTVAGIDAIINELRRRLPRTKILLLGILPSERSAWVTQTTDAINRTLAQRYGHNENVTYLDVGWVFFKDGRVDRSKDGRVDRSLFFDPLIKSDGVALHPTAQGQERMAEAIEPTLSRLMRDRNKVAPQ
ncbi:MAG: hypothetical protein JOY71_22540 [Acetobacteraceae bacterium]|nr:hypothetical protein [Acetobacteraceae bacterium]